MVGFHYTLWAHTTDGARILLTMADLDHSVESISDVFDLASVINAIESDRWVRDIHGRTMVRGSSIIGLNMQCDPLVGAQIPEESQ